MLVPVPVLLLSPNRIWRAAPRIEPRNRGGEQNSTHQLARAMARARRRFRSLGAAVNFFGAGAAPRNHSPQQDQ